MPLNRKNLSILNLNFSHHFLNLNQSHSLNDLAYLEAKEMTEQFRT